MKKSLLIVLTIAFLNSCAFHSGYVSSSLAPENVIFEDLAYGFSETSHFLSFGGLKKNTLVLDAKKDLYRNHPLKKGERFINFTVDFKTTTILLFTNKRCTVSADVVTVGTEVESAEELYSSAYKNEIARASDVSQLFSIGDTVVDYVLEPQIVKGFSSNGKIVLQRISEKGNTQNHKAKAIRFYITKGSYKGYSIGEVVRIKSRKYEIVALGLNRILYKENYFVLSENYNNLNKVN